MTGTGIHRALAALAAAAGLATAAGCGAGGTPSQGGTPASSAAGSTEIPAELEIGSAQKVLTLDPDLAADGYSEGVVHLLGGNLYELGGDRKVRPLLVESGDVSRDGLTWTFALRSGLKFSDGSALTAEDVKATFERAKDDEANVYIGFVEPIASVRTPDETTVEMRLSRPYPSLPVVLSQPEMTILPSEGLAKGEAFFDAPVSAGQYMLESWGGGSEAVLVRNPHYAGTPPAVERLVFRTIEDFNARLAQVQSGQVDLALDIPPRLLAKPAPGLVASLTPHYGFTTLPLNVNSPPLDEVRVRKAIASAIDREQLNETVWNGQAEPIAGFWPTTMTGYDPGVPTARDLDTARRELRGTSCERGCTVRFMYSSANPWAEPTATVVAQNLGDVGIRVKLEKVDDATFNERLGEIDFQIALSFLYDYNDVPDGMLTYAMTADGGLSANFTGFEPPPEIDRAVEQAITRDGAERDEALAEIDTLFREHQPFVTLSTYAVGTLSRYRPEIVKTNEAGFVDVAREGGP